MTIEKFRYRTDSAGANGTHGLVAELSLYRDSGELSRLGFPVRSFTIKRRDTESLRRPSDELVFVTAASENFVTPVFTAIALVQKYFPASPIYFYDLSDVDLGNGQQVSDFYHSRFAILSKTSTLLSSYCCCELFNRTAAKAADK